MPEGATGRGDQPRPLPVLLGEAPSRGGDRYHVFPLSGPPARVLCTLAGIPPQDEGSTYGRWTWALYERFECRNLIERYARATPWSVVTAREAAAGLTDLLEGERVVVCLGRRVHRAVFEGLELGPAPGFHEWRTVGGARLVAVPHPSGLNRLLNEPDERARVGATLREALG